MRFFGYLLLSSPKKNAGAELAEDGVRVARPWGEVGLEPITLKTAWYVFSTTSKNAVSLVLREKKTYTVVELVAQSGKDAYVRLIEGCYTPAFCAGVRPGFYTLGEISLRRLPATSKFKLLGGRLFSAINSGIPIGDIIRLISMALWPRGTFGVRPPHLVRQTIGPMLLSDMVSINKPAEGEPSEDAQVKFLVRYKFGPILEDTHGLGLQNYRLFTTDLAEDHDAVLYLAEGEILMPDALSLFAAVLITERMKSIVLADVYVGETLTTRVAFDPLLYGQDNYPTPFVIRSQIKNFGLRWNELESMHHIISVPVAHAQRDSFLPPGKLLNPQLRQKVSIIIPTRDRADLLKTCLSGLFNATDWPHEVIVVDNGSIEESTFELLEEYEGLGLKTIRADIPFNFSKLCNIGARASTGDFVVFMNNDIELISENWLQEMMTYATMTDVGVVGARLIYRNRSLQHGGVALGLTQLCGHMWRGLSPEHQERMPALRHASLRSAVSGALICVSREKFDSAGGFDEECFPITLNDIDLCLKMRTMGLYNVLASQAVALHPESESRGKDISIEQRTRRQAEMDNFYNRWKDNMEKDEWFPEAFSRATEQFLLR